MGTSQGSWWLVSRWEKPFNAKICRPPIKAPGTLGGSIEGMIGWGSTVCYEPISAAGQSSFHKW